MGYTSACSDCIQKHTSTLNFLPKTWAEGIAKVICNILGDAGTPSCDDVKKCETLTNLSPFEISNGQVCITFTGEDHVSVKRCFDIGLLLNSSLDIIDPKCVTTPSTWSNLSFSQRMQSIIDAHEQCCCGGTTSTTTTTIAPSTTSTTTLVPPDCLTYILNNPTSNQLAYSYIECGSNIISHFNLEPNTQAIRCAVNNSISSQLGIVVTPTGACQEPSTTTTTTQTSSTTSTTTLVGSPTTTSTTSTTTIAPPACVAYVVKNTSGVSKDYLYTDCDGNTLGGSLANNESSAPFCAQAGSIIQTGLQVSQFGNCISGQPCNEYNITNTSSSPVIVNYQDCATTTGHAYSLPAGNQLIVCAIIGSVSVVGCPSCTIVANGTCVPPTTTTTTTLVDHNNDPNEFTISGLGGIQGICHYDSTQVQRSTAATNDSLLFNERIKVTVRYSSDGVGGAFQDTNYVFEIGNTVANENWPINLDSGGGCSTIVANIINIQVI